LRGRKFEGKEIGDQSVVWCREEDYFEVGGEFLGGMNEVGSRDLKV